MITIREADLDRDSEEVVELLRRHLTVRSNIASFNWQYKNSPHGVATLWLAVDEDTGAIVGSAGIVPTTLQLATSTISVAVMLDFWIHPDHRVLGPAVKLQRACIEGARTAGLPLFIDLPQRSMTAVYRRLKIEPNMRLLRLARPLDVETYLTKIPSIKPLARPLGYIGNALLKTVEHVQLRAGEIDSTEQTVQFGPEYSALSASKAKSGKSFVARTAAYLNWRYRDHYFLKHRLFTARREGRLLAYAVLTVEKNSAQVVDFFGELSRPVIRSLLGTVIRKLRADGVSTINLPLSSTSELHPELRRLGFRARQDAAVIVQSIVDDNRIDLGAFEFTYGDMDF